MKNKKTIMDSHEVFCEELIEAVKKYTIDELLLRNGSLFSKVKLEKSKISFPR